MEKSESKMAQLSKGHLKNGTVLVKLEHVMKSNRIKTKMNQRKYQPEKQNEMNAVNQNFKSRPDCVRTLIQREMGK